MTTVTVVLYCSACYVVCDGEDFRTAVHWHWLLAALARARADPGDTTFTGQLLLYRS